MAFGLEFFDVAPGLRVAGDSLAYVYKFTKKGGEGSGSKGLEIGLTDDPTIKLLETSVSGYEYQSNTDGVYQSLVVGGLTELVGGLAIGVDSLSSIETSDTEVKLSIAGAQPPLRFRPGRVPEVTKVSDQGYQWELPPASFVALKAAAETYQSELKARIDLLVAQRVAADDSLAADVAGEVLNRINADGVLQQAIDAQAIADADARSLLSGRIDALEADPTTAAAVAAGDAATLSSANSYTDTEVSAEALTRGNADSALSGRLDVLEADPTTAAAVTAVQNDVDANELASTAADSALSGRLDVLEADPTTAAAVAAVQTNLDTEAGLRAAADSALDGRLDVLEADPTTAAAVAAVQADVDQNEADADAALALKAPLASPDFTGQLEVDVNLRLEYDSNLTKIHNVLRGTSIEIGNNIQMKPAAAGGRVEIAGALQIDITEVPDAANDVQAAAAGVVVGGLYRSNSVLHIRVS